MKVLRARLYQQERQKQDDKLQEMSYEEIGTVLGIAAGTVKSRLHRGRGALRDRLRKRMAPTAGMGGTEKMGEEEGEGR